MAINKIEINTVNEFTVSHILKHCLEVCVSDVFIATDDYIRVGKSGKHSILSTDKLNSYEIDEITRSLVDEARLTRLYDGYAISDSYRLVDKGDVSKFRNFRISISNFTPQQGVGKNIAIRVIDEYAPTLDQIGIPAHLAERIRTSPNGLILVIGATGQGKSTTLAALIRYILEKQSNKRILEFSRPIEYTYHNIEWDESCHIRQHSVREGSVGGNLIDYAESIALAVRQKPDTILIGEMTEFESIKAAITASNTGHQLLSTLHANCVSAAFSRIYTLFPHSERQALLHELLVEMDIFISQRLVPKIGGGLIAIREWLENSKDVRAAISEAKNEVEIKNIVEEIMQQSGTNFFSQAYDYYTKGIIEKSELDKFNN